MVSVRMNLPRQPWQFTILAALAACVAGVRFFHDVPADGFNLDHVVISPRWIYVIETKTISKSAGDARVGAGAEGDCRVDGAGGRVDFG